MSFVPILKFAIAIYLTIVYNEQLTSTYEVTSVCSHKNIVNLELMEMGLLGSSQSTFSLILPNAGISFVFWWKGIFTFWDEDNL